MEISELEIEPGYCKVKVIKKYLTPKNVHQLRRFLRLVGFFRIFVPDFAMIAQPLYDLLKADAKYRSTEKNRLRSKNLYQPLFPNRFHNCMTPTEKRSCKPMLQKQVWVQ